MEAPVLYGLLIPLAGTMLGSACVFFMRRQLRDGIQRALTGFASGVMTAASIWSLLIPAMDQVSGWGVWAFFPAAAGFWLGILFLLLLDHLIPHLHQRSNQTEGLKSHLGHRTMLTLAVTLHNIPEGMAVGVVYAGYLMENPQITLTGAFALSLGIAIQNFPEGAILSLPLHAEGAGKWSAFWSGALSGAGEPAAARVTTLASGFAMVLIPFVVVGALLCLVCLVTGTLPLLAVEELIPEMSQGAHSNVGVLSFAAGFTLMMALDVALG